MRRRQAGRVVASGGLVNLEREERGGHNRRIGGNGIPGR
jgi:hypothetical protein